MQRRKNLKMLIKENSDNGSEKNIKETEKKGVTRSKIILAEIWSA